MAAQGCSERETAAALNLAPATVRNHLQRARRRLDARNTTEAVARAMAAGWLTDTDRPCGATGA
jgi:DNA-binding CsgD family transcriptional regulator